MHVDKNLLWWWFYLVKMALFYTTGRILFILQFVSVVVALYNYEALTLQIRHFLSACVVPLCCREPRSNSLPDLEWTVHSFVLLHGNPAFYASVRTYLTCNSTRADVLWCPLLVGTDRNFRQEECLRAPCLLLENKFAW